MKIASRFMPKYVRPKGGRIAAWMFLGVMASCLVYFFWNYPIGTTIVVLGFVLLVVVERYRGRKRLAALAASRTGESICEFARSFDGHSVDTWVVRAVYEQLQKYLGPRYQIPIRASDVFDQDLPIDSEDLDMDIASEMAQRTARSMENMEANPFYGKVKTVADLVHFFNAQPKAT
jgi:hypothetical protein